MVDQAIGNGLLATLPVEVISTLRPHFREAFYKSGMLLQTAGEPIEHAFFPQSGLISVHIGSDACSEVNVAAVGREGGIGLRAAIGLTVALNTAIMQVAGSVVRIAIDHFRNAVDNHDALRDLVIRYNEAFMIEVQQTAACNALHSVEHRLCRWLLHMHDRADRDLIPLTQQLLSNMLGVQRPTVTLVARRLQTAGLIRYRWGAVEILNRRGIEAAACGCYAAVRSQTAHIGLESKRPNLMPRMSSGGDVRSRHYHHHT
jgi:CRP-like cAMP-binding protein